MTITVEELRRMQALPLSEKVEISKSRIKDWYEHFGGKVYVAFSGGKDSTVLLHLVRSLYPEVPAVFNDTGIDFPEVKEQVKQTDNVIILKPKKNFRQVIEEHGVVFPSKEVACLIHLAQRGTKWAKMRLEGKYANGTVKPYATNFVRWKFLLDAPFKVSDKCCDCLKKEPDREFQKESGLVPFVGIMTSESHHRLLELLVRGSCNPYDSTHPSSMPIAFWTDQDILLYIYNNNIEIPSVYGDIVIGKNGKLTTTREKRTGCMFCLIGSHLEKPNKFQRMRETHPARYKYCMEQLGLGKILTWLNIPH